MSSFLRFWDKGVNLLNAIANIIGASILLLSTLSIASEAFTRVFLKKSWAAMEEMPRLFMVYLVFLLMGFLYRQGRHITVDLAEVTLKERPLAKGIFALIVHICTLIGATMLFYAGILGVQGFDTMGYMTETEIQIPISTIYWGVPIGSAILMILCVEGVIKSMTFIYGAIKAK